MHKRRLLLILIGDTVGEKPTKEILVQGKSTEGTSDQADRHFQVLELISGKFDSAAGCS